jgi:CheY-like chemotaxis protein
VSREKILQVLDKVKREMPRKYVLLVDDDPDFREIASRAIEKEGWHVQTAENGIAALALLEHEPPSIIFLDLMMPLMDGFEFLTIIQSRREWEHLPVVIVTSKNLSVDERSHLEKAAKKVIQKGDLTAEKLLKQLALLIPNLTHHTSS